MFLVVDIGNTNVTLGVFDKENLINVYKISSDKELPQQDYEFLLNEMLKNYKIEQSIIISVVNEITQIFKKACDKVFNINSFVIDSPAEFGFTLNIDNENELGIDRIANMYALKKLYPEVKTPIIIVDVGTAITVDLMSSSEIFEGGIIMPGLQLQINSLYQNTSKLPKISISTCKNLIGKNTHDCILSGIVYGVASSIDGLVERIFSTLEDKPFVVITGGNAELIAKYTKTNFDLVNKTLMLDGLNYFLNAKLSV